jgi:DNA-binding MarR family transcriptional regulator
MSRRDDLREIDRALHRITRIGRGRTAAALRASRSGVDLSRTGVSIHAALVQRGPLRPTAIAEHADAEPAIVTRELRVLTAQGFLRSEPDPSDGRARIVEITDEGRTAIGRYREAIDEIIAETFAGWSGRELTDLRRVLERVAKDFARPTDADVQQDQ